MSEIHEEYIDYDLAIEELYYVPSLMSKVPDALVERLKFTEIEEIEEAFQKTEDELMETSGYDKGTKLRSLLDWEIAAAVPEWLLDHIEDGFFAVIATPHIGCGTGSSTSWKCFHIKFVYAKDIDALTKIGREWVEEKDRQQYEKEKKCN